jgi:hypothetical protein
MARLGMGVPWATRMPLDNHDLKEPAVTSISRLSFDSVTSE